MVRQTKTAAYKEIISSLPGSYEGWVIKHGHLKRGRGRPSKTKHLFKIVGEKIPLSALSKIRNSMKSLGFTSNGVYVAHDSMGCPRYIGRGSIFTRLDSHRKKYALELKYFSFYVVEDKKHEREIETLLIRAAGPLLSFNARKKGDDIQAGKINDFEAGTLFYERQWRRGRRAQRRGAK